MLKVSIHAGPWQEASVYNRLDWLDIGYHRLEARADYKIVLFKVGEDAMPPVILKKYPRWSASMWDLVAHSIALTLKKYPTPDGVGLSEKIFAKRSATAESMCAIVSHFPNGGVGARHVGRLEIDRIAGTRCTYLAKATEDVLGDRVATEFQLATRFLRPAELALRAISALLYPGATQLPPVPSLYIPDTILVNGKQHVLIEEIEEPAKTGFLRWVHRNEMVLSKDPAAPAASVHQDVYARFMKEAV
jgi:hypothetical protein